MTGSAQVTKNLTLTAQGPRVKTFNTGLKNGGVGSSNIYDSYRNATKLINECIVQSLPEMQSMETSVETHRKTLCRE